MQDEQAQEPSEQTDAVMPTEEQTTDEGEQTLPAEVSDRTAAEFEKLKAHNAELKKQLEAKEQLSTPRKSVYDNLRPHQQVVAPVVDTQQDQFVDEQGYVDTELLNKKLADSDRVAKQAIAVANQATESLRRMEETQASREVYAKYPQLDPYNEAFDPEMVDLVTGELLRQMTQEGKEDLMGASDKIFSKFAKSLETRDTQEQMQENSTLKQQASSTSVGRAQGARQSGNYDELVNETRKGNAEALYERLQRIGA